MALLNFGTDPASDAGPPAVCPYGHRRGMRIPCNVADPRDNTVLVQQVHDLYPSSEIRRLPRHRQAEAEPARPARRRSCVQWTARGRAHRCQPNRQASPRKKWVDRWTKESGKTPIPERSPSRQMRGGQGASNAAAHDDHVMMRIRGWHGRSEVPSSAPDAPLRAGTCRWVASESAHLLGTSAVMPVIMPPSTEVSRSGALGPAVFRCLAQHFTVRLNCAKVPAGLSCHTHTCRS